MAALRVGKIAEGMDPDQAERLPKRFFIKNRHLMRRIPHRLELATRLETVFERFDHLPDAQGNALITEQVRTFICLVRCLPSRVRCDHSGQATWSTSETAACLTPPASPCTSTSDATAACRSTCAREAPRNLKATTSTHEKDDKSAENFAGVADDDANRLFQLSLAHQGIDSQSWSMRLRVLRALALGRHFEEHRRVGLCVFCSRTGSRLFLTTRSRLSRSTSPRSVGTPPLLDPDCPPRRTWAADPTAPTARTRTTIWTMTPTTT